MLRGLKKNQNDSEVYAGVTSLDKQRVNICHLLSSHLLISEMHSKLGLFPTYGCALVQLEEGMGRCEEEERGTGL